MIHEKPLTESFKNASTTRCHRISGFFFYQFEELFKKRLKSNQTGPNQPSMRETLLSNREREERGSTGAWQDRECVCVCVCVRVSDRGVPCLFHWLAPVTTHQQHTKPPEDASLSLTRSVVLAALIPSPALIVDCFASLGLLPF